MLALIEWRPREIIIVINQIDRRHRVGIWYTWYIQYVWSFRHGADVLVLYWGRESVVTSVPMY